MSTTLNVAIVIGSLRKGSISGRLAKALQSIAPPSLSLHEVTIGELPLYDQDADASPPAAWTTFREAIRGSDAVLFITPEYNRSVPGGLKNAIDVGSRPYGKSAWSGKPAAIISQSPGAIAGFGANHHLRQSLVFLDMPILQQPEAYLGGSDKLVSEAGEFTQDGTKAFMTKFLTTFEQWIRKTGQAA